MTLQETSGDIPPPFGNADGDGGGGAAVSPGGGGGREGAADGPRRRAEDSPSSEPRQLSMTPPVRVTSSRPSRSSSWISPQAAARARSSSAIEAGFRAPPVTGLDDEVRGGDGVRRGDMLFPVEGSSLKPLVKGGDGGGPGGGGGPGAAALIGVARINGGGGGGPGGGSAGAVFEGIGGGGGGPGGGGAASLLAF